METIKPADSTNEYKKSLFSLHIAVMFFGLSAVIGQFVDVPSVIVAGGRVICSSLLLLAISLVLKESLKLHQKKDYGIAVFAGVILAIHWTTFFQSVQTASVAIGTITFSTFPLFLTFLEPLVFHEKLKVRSIVEAVVLLIGVFITIPEFSLQNQTTIGIIWGMICSLTYAILSLCNRYLSARYISRTVCIYEQGTAAIVLLPAFFLIKISWTASNILGIAAIGFICTALAHSLYVAAQRKVSAQTAGIISGMETVYGIVFALIFLGEIPTVREIVGGVIILGVALVSSLAVSNSSEN